MPEENRVFDVTKPKHVSPSATSKPVIVGHHPIISDPMVKDESSATKIEVTESGSSNDNSYIVSSSGEHAEPTINPPTDEEIKAAENEVQLPPDETNDPNAAFKISPTEAETVPALEAAADEPNSESHSPPMSDETTPTESTPPEPASEAETTAPQEPIQPLPQIEGLHLPEAKHRGRGLKWILLILVILIGAYLAIDAGALGSNIKLPFHVFKQKTSSAPATTTQTPAATQPKPSLPSGFKEYKIATTSITFAAPLAWGEPGSTTDPGFSKRGGDNQTDGTFAYLVNFANNKDIQIAVTSNKYLPAARAAMYYDFLQWCTGTSDGQYYQSVLKFTTSNKVDTPTTVTCDQGPLSDVVKINSTTIEQTKVKDTANAVIGDIYTKNLNGPELVVIRVKDAAMSNGDNVKQLLDSVKTGTTNS